MIQLFGPICRARNEYIVDPLGWHEYSSKSIAFADKVVELLNCFEPLEDVNCSAAVSNTESMQTLFQVNPRKTLAAFIKDELHFNVLLPDNADFNDIAFAIRAVESQKAPSVQKTFSFKKSQFLEFFGASPTNTLGTGWLVQVWKQEALEFLEKNNVLSFPCGLYAERVVFIQLCHLNEETTVFQVQSGLSRVEEIEMELKRAKRLCSGIPFEFEFVISDTGIAATRRLEDA